MFIEIATALGRRYKIDELDHVVHPRDGHPRILAVLDAYLDETGIHDGAAVCVIAGYFGGKGQWKKFERDWRLALKKSDVPLEEFHALNFMKRRKFFYGWDDKRHQTLGDRLIAAISSHKIHPVSVALVVRDFLALPMVQRRFFTGATIVNRRIKTSGCPNRPYFLAFQTCTRIAASYAPVGGKCHFFFGLDRPFAKYAVSLYKIIKDSARPDETRPKLGDIDFPEAKETPQLNAADLFAYLTFQKVTENGFGTAASGWLLQCLTNTRMASDHVYYDAAALQASLKEANEKFGGFEGSVPVFEREEEQDLPE